MITFNTVLSAIRSNNIFAANAIYNHIKTNYDQLWHEHCFYENENSNINLKSIALNFIKDQDQSLYDQVIEQLEFIRINQDVNEILNDDIDPLEEAQLLDQYCEVSEHEIFNEKLDMYWNEY